MCVFLHLCQASRRTLKHSCSKMLLNCIYEPVFVILLCIYLFPLWLLYLQSALSVIKLTDTGKFTLLLLLLCRNNGVNAAQPNSRKRLSNAQHPNIFLVRVAKTRPCSLMWRSSNHTHFACACWLQRSSEAHWKCIATLFFRDLLKKLESSCLTLNVGLCVVKTQNLMNKVNLNAFER